MYALEGAIFVTGAAVQWLRDGLGIIADAAETGPLAESCPDTEGVYLVPAFTGLGSPWWDPYARGTIVGITRGTGRAHLARAVVESMAYQVRDVVDRSCPPRPAAPSSCLRADGGASAMDLLLQLQADQLQVPVARPRQPGDHRASAPPTSPAWPRASGPASTTSRQAWHLDAQFEPEATAEDADAKHAMWLRAVERSRGWAPSAADS